MCSFGSFSSKHHILNTMVAPISLSLLSRLLLRFAPSPTVRGEAKARRRIVPPGLSLLYKTLWALQYPQSRLCSGLPRHLVADICTEQRGQLELQPKFWLCSCQLERERRREIQVCLLQFSIRPKITSDAHNSDIMSCCTISGSHTLVIAENVILPVKSRTCSHWCRVACVCHLV